MKNLIKFMKKKIYIIENVDKKKSKSITLILKKKEDETFELIA